MTRKSTKTFASKDSAAYFTISSVLELWATNSQAQSKTACVELRAYDVEAGIFVEFEADGWNNGKREISLSPNATTEIWKGRTPGIDDIHVEGMRSRPVVIQARLIEVDTGIVLARYSNWRVVCLLVRHPTKLFSRPEPFKYIHFPTPEQVNLKIVPEAGPGGELSTTSLSISADRPVKGLVLDVDGPWAKFSDQAIDLFPGDTQVVGVVGLDGRQVKARYLGDGSA